MAKYERRQSKGDDKSTVGGRSRLASAPGPAGGGGGGPGAVRHLPFFALPDDDLLDTVSVHLIFISYPTISQEQRCKEAQVQERLFEGDRQEGVEYFYCSYN